MIVMTAGGAILLLAEILVESLYEDRYPGWGRRLGGDSG
jgi:hypothetical protein